MLQGIDMQQWKSTHRHTLIIAWIDRRFSHSKRASEVSEFEIGKKWLTACCVTIKSAVAIAAAAAADAGLAKCLCNVTNTIFNLRNQNPKIAFSWKMEKHLTLERI